MNPGRFILLGPTSINILLSQFRFILGLLPVFGYLPILDLVIFIPTVSLAGFIYEGCIDDAPRVGLDPFFFENFPELIEKFRHSPRLR